LVGVAGIIQAASEPDRETQSSSNHEWHAVDTLNEYYGEYGPVRRLISRGRSRSSSSSSTSPKKVKEWCDNPLDSCSQRLKEYDRVDFSDTGEWLLDVLRLAPTRRRRGTLRTENPRVAEGCNVDTNADLRQTCTTTMATGNRPCSWVNLAGIHPTSASSLQPGNSTIAHAVDGDDLTRWIPSDGPAQKLVPYWLAVDLAVAHDLCRIEMKWQAAPGSVLIVQGSTDGTTWTDMASQTFKASEWDGVEFGDNSRARWVRLYSQSEISIYGIEIYEVISRYPRRLEPRRLQPLSAHHATLRQQCISGVASVTSCCEVCLACNTLSCAIDLPNCTRFLSDAYTDCSENKVDTHCCKALWWFGSTCGFICAITFLACFCYIRKRNKLRREKQIDYVAAVLERQQHETSTVSAL